MTIKKYLNPISIISYGLGFVALWFGINELVNPAGWVAYAPAFLGEGELTITLIFVHGLALTLAGVMVVLNFYRRLGALVLALMFLQIIADLIWQSGFSEIVARDIGLLSIAIALSLKMEKNTE